MTNDSYTGVSMNKEDGYWGDGFEDVVARALILCFESKIIKARGARPQDRLTEARLSAMRSCAPYIPSEDRWVIGSWDEQVQRFDVMNDPLPAQGHVAIPWDKYGSYLTGTYLRRVSQLGLGWRRADGGFLYEMVWANAQQAGGIYGERCFVSVTKDGRVVPCTFPDLHRFQPELRRNWGLQASCSLQWIADRRFCWVIAAQEKTARADLGCAKEQIKSLLYARSLPLSATGRKRPILHLVEAHKRRVKNGTDIDVTSFLRGVQTVDIDGTRFTVKPPEALRPTMSRPSVERYYEPRAAASNVRAGAP